MVNLEISDLFGLMYKLQPNIQSISKLRLLILAASIDQEIISIIKILQEANICFNYEIAPVDNSVLLLKSNTYDAILLKDPDFLVWLHQYQKKIPLILILRAENWDSQLENLKSENINYVDKNSLSLLPTILKRCLKLAQIQEDQKHQLLMRRMSQLMQETLVLEELLQSMVDMIHEALGVYGCLIFRFYPDSKRRIWYASNDTDASSNLVNLCCEISNYNHYLLLQGKPLVCNQVRDCLESQLLETALKNKVSSFVLRPLIYQNSYCGEIWIHCQNNHQWSDNELTTIHTIATQSAMAISKAQLYHKLQQQKQKEKLQRQLTQKINSNLNSQQILEAILQEIGEKFRFHRVILFSLGNENIEIKQQWLIDNQIPSLKLKTPISSELRELKELKEINILDENLSEKITENIKKVIDGLPLESLLTVPILLHKKLFGILVLETNIETKTITEDDLDLLSAIAEQISLAIHFEELVKSRTQELEKEKKRIENANRAKSEFLSHMNHELRTPLTAIMGFSRMLKQELYGELNAKQMQYVSAICDSGEHLLELINDLLDISKIEAEREELYLEKFPVEEVCLASMCLVEEKARQQGLELILDISEEVSFCMADRRRLKQILVNLLSNAVKFTEEGSVTLKVEIGEKMLEFSVIDTGIGIKEDDCKKLFQPFSQINNHLTRKHKGTGLGLALSLKLARLHGGDLTLKSNYTQGSCFTVYLPL